jgi:putative transposase
MISRQSIGFIFGLPTRSNPPSPATVRLRTAKTRGCLSRESILAMVFMLAKSAERRWLKLKGASHLAEVIQGVSFKDGVQEDQEKIAA